MSETRAHLESVYRSEARRVLATLIRLLGSFDAAEEAMHEAFAVAAEQWPRDGVPHNPHAWLVSTGRFKAIDRRRREASLARVAPELALDADPPRLEEIVSRVEDDELSLIFMCCHPDLAPDARIALTLREVGGLTTEEIARAYLVSPPTIAQRIVRAKTKLRAGKIPFEIPQSSELTSRVESVLQVIYLVFNEGYATTDAATVTREDLCVEAIRLARLLVHLLDDAETRGLLALLLINDSRRATRTDENGDLVLFAVQDRARWNQALIREAQTHIDHALGTHRVGPYLLQAAIASLQVEERIDWTEIVGLYDVLARVAPSPIVSLNRAVAIGMRDGPRAGLASVEEAIAAGGLATYHLAYAALADMHRQLGNGVAAREAYERALQLARQPAEQRFLRARIAEL